MKKNRLLLFAHDAGSANMIIAYIYFYKNKYSEILAFPQGPAKKLSQIYIQEYMTTESLFFFQTDTVVTGTSGIDSEYEMKIIIQAREANVHKIITILDNTANFNMRFSLHGKLLKKEFLPDEIWIDQENFKSDIDYFNKHIVYKNNIYDKYIIKLFKNNPPKFTNKNIIKYNGSYLVILTDYLSDLYGNLFGFSEFDYLENILNVIDKLHLDVAIFIKLHPSEKNTKYDPIITKYQNLNIFKDDFNVHELIYYSRVVFGMSSSVFKEAIMFEKSCFSIQIGATKDMQTILESKFNIKSKDILIEILLYYFKLKIVKKGKIKWKI